MWKSLTLCIVLSICRDARGAIGDQMAEVIQLCCDDGSAYARNNTGTECNVPRAPADVPEAFGSLCVMAQAQCCRDYFKKKAACEGGIVMALTSGKCPGNKDATKVCCDECSRGTTAGLAGGIDGCVSRAKGATAEELLSDDAYIKCCKKSATEGPPTFTPKPQTTLASVCEEYAPNELCAHHCIPIPGSYRCECNPGFMLMADGRNCREVTRNRCKPRNPCQHKCNDNGLAVLCSCRRGYELMPDGKSCQDIDECQLNIPVCLPSTTCTNLQGSYRCISNKPRPALDRSMGQCPPGFARNLRNNACDDINECKLPRPPCPAAHCVNTVGGYKCDGRVGDPVSLAAARADDDRCPPGFAMNQKGECQDVDECAILKDDCNRLSQFCVNTHGSFYCQDMASKHCRPGFKIDPVTGRCEDINECEDDSDICRKDQICVNQLGQYDCKMKDPISETRPTNGRCPDGMRYNADTQVCDDVDECVEGTHLCDQHQRCLNTNGSFECHCKLGYELDATTGACVDVNECATHQHDCLPNSQRCDNTIGSFLCIRITSCGTGYILQHSTGNCEDVDECALGTHNCGSAGPEYQCMNIPGSFRCVRKRASTTTTTTPAPEYEYEYYDSDEEIEDTSANKTDAGVNVPTNINPAPPSSEVPPTPNINTSDPEIVSKEQKPDEREPEVPENNHINPKEDERKPINYVPEVPRYVAPLEIPQLPSRQSTPPVPPMPEPDIVYKPNSEPKPQIETPASTYYETRPDKPISSNEIPDDKPTERQAPFETTERIAEEPMEIPDQRPYDTPNQRPYETPNQRPNETPNQRPYEIPSQRPTYSPYKPTVQTPIAPTLWQNIPHETVTVDDRKNEGAMTDASNVPKKDRPNCPPGFEYSDNGGCFDIDECTTGQHGCSGITETCRNTMGGYVCDCAIGFRRDIVTNACDLIITSTSTTTTTTEPPLPPPTLPPPTLPPPTLPPPTLPPPTLPPTLPPTTTPEPASSTTPREFFFGYKDDRPTVTRKFMSHTACDYGLFLNYNTGNCEDIDECTNGEASCAAVEVCVNTRGGYRCECPPNWELDDVRHRCMPQRNKDAFPPGYGNEPVYPPDVPQSNGDRSSTGEVVSPEIMQEATKTVLKCPLGYRLDGDDSCVDVNECATGEAKCGPQQICINLEKGYTCRCMSGYRLIGDHECQDIDECQLAGNRTICSQNANCVNTPGSYHCKCHAGFRPAPLNDKVCVDVDECAESQAFSLCEHRCTNVWGGYRCSCHRGYRLNFDNRTCTDVDECSDNTRIRCVGHCLNEPGSYRCACPIGYRLSEDQKSCIDIDECETGQATCETGTTFGTSQVCFNTRGSYRCHRITCPQGYALESKHRCTKAERVCQPGDWACAHQPTTISYNFITFVSNLYVPEANVKLFTMRGPAWPFTELNFRLRIVDVDSPPNVQEPANINSFLLTQSGHEAVISLVHPLQGPQSIELELAMELHTREQFGGIAIAKIFIYVSEYEY